MSIGGTFGDLQFLLRTLICSTLLAGCSGSPQERSACVQRTEPLTEGLCALPAADAAHVETVLGLSELAPPLASNSTAGVTACSYCGPGSVLIHLQESSSEDSFAIYRRALEQGNQTTSTDFPGFGDEAFTLPLRLKKVVVEMCLGARQGSWGVLVCARDVSIEKLQALAVDLFADLEN